MSAATLSGTDDAYIYQAKSNAMEWLRPPVDFTSDSGYEVRTNGSAQASGSATQPSAGWANIQNSSGAGLLIGHYQPAAYYPKVSGVQRWGRRHASGHLAADEQFPYYQAWPQHSTHDMLFSFHDSALSSNANEFLEFQHPLLGRAALAHYNASRVFPYPFVDAQTEDRSAQRHSRPRFHR